MDIEQYETKDLLKLIKKSPLRWYLLFNRGVGAWFWKPVIIKDAMKRHPGKIILYLDSDCVITDNPKVVISKKVVEDGLYLFNQQIMIGNWTSSRCLGRMNADSSEIKRSPMKTAGVIAAKSSIGNVKSLDVWLEEMSDPLKLIEPIRKSGHHRHDQSILSILSVKGLITVKDLGTGFFSRGPESLSENIGLSWVATGNVYPEDSNHSENIPLKNYASYFKYLALNYSYKIFILPVHFIFFKASRN